MNRDHTQRAVDVPLRILRVGATWLAVDKPSGFLSVPGRVQHDCVVNRVRAAYPTARGPIAPHRLDMDTSGVMLCALTAEAHRNLSLQFQNRTVAKRYHALLSAPIDRASEGLIDLPLRLDVERRPYQIVDLAQGKSAQTRYRILEVRPHTRPDGSGMESALVEFEPITGRSHQLRVHSADPRGLGAPILGDDLYAGEHAKSAPRLMLHASMLAFDDPETGERVEITSSASFA